MIEFNRLLLVACISIVVALILYFFYWNRFIGFVIGRAIRILFWNQEGSSIWVEIGSIHFSLLTGRILLKDVRYHSSNQTIKVVTGQLQWRYWTRRPTSEEDLNSTRGEDVKDSALLSCRIQLSFQGLEWFIYNRSAAYDGIVDQMEKMSRPNSRSSSHRRFFSRFSRQDNTSPFQAPSLVRSALHVPAVITRAVEYIRRQLPILDPKDLLPLGINVQTGAIILGNPSTPDLLVAEFHSALGTYSTSPSRSKLDLYKQVYSFRFQSNRIRFVENEDYVDPMATLGALVHSGIKLQPTLRKYVSSQSYRTFQKLWRQVGLYQLVIDYFTTRRAQRHKDSTHTSAFPFRKSKKPTDEGTPIGRDFSVIEYVIERRILEAPVLELTYYVDVVGEVLSHSIRPQFGGHGIYDIGNGDTDPEWGFTVVVYGGILRYGPWSDRQRTDLQRTFFPPTYRDSEVTHRLKPGDKRTWTSLQIFIELREETSLHIPFREASKDWQWDGVVAMPQRPRKREAATINVTVGDRSSINYLLPMVIGPRGYETSLEVHLDTMVVTSSLNDIRLITSESARIRCELPSPLKWDAERTWLIAMYLRQPSLFLLRDHVNMFTDLGKDWASGPPADYQKFIPMIYVFRLEMHHFEVNMYTNDQNIVDKPLVREENALTTLRGPHLKSITTIPLNKFRSEITVIGFDITSPDIVLDISLPRWNIHAMHMSPGAVNLFKAKTFEVNGSYLYFSEIRDENVEHLKLNFDVRNPTYYAYGWSIRYFLILRDNYIGSFTHFQTLSEYLDKRKQNLPVGDPIKLSYRPGKANMLEVEMSLNIATAQVIQPVNLIGPSTDIHSSKFGSAEKDTYHVVLTAPEIQVQLRVHDFYMDMSVNTDPITGSIKRTYSDRSQESASEVLLIDGIDVTANRLFGPQPRTATYVCIWEIAIGTIKSSLSANEAQLLAAAGDSFRMNFVDRLNAPADDFVPNADLDVTFYKIATKSIEVTWRAGNAALLLKLSQGLKFDSNDLGAHQYHRVISLRVPHISGNILLTKDMERNSWLEAAEVNGDAYLDIYSSPVGHRLITRNQLAFIEEQDKLTNRAKLMFNQLRQRTKMNPQSDRMSHRSSIYLPQPRLPNVTHNVTRTGRPPELDTPAPRRYSSRFSTLANLSDSDGEEWISEADRDARLARTRTSTPVTQGPEDDVTLSSGDESDNADLTEGESSGDEWSDFDGLPSTHPNSSLMSFYSPILRHYVLNWEHGVRTWEGPAYILSKEGPSFMRPERSETLDKAATNPLLFKLPEDVPKSEDVTTLRIRFAESLRVVFNPLLLQAALYFEEDIKNITPDPALYIDSLLAKAISKALMKKSKVCLVLDVDLPHAILQVMQHIAMSDDGHPDMNKSMHSTTPSNLDVVSVITCNLSGLRLGGIFGQKSTTVKISLEQAVTVMDMPIDKRSVSSSATDSNIVAITICLFSFQLSRCVLSSKLDEIAIKIGHRGPEFTVATFFALASAGSALLRLFHELRGRHEESERRIISYILKASEHDSIIDPLSTIQPSYLVQNGVPHLLRTDAAFKFLYHLQNCLWNIQSSIPQPDSSSDVISSSELISAVESRLAIIDPDSLGIEHLSSMDSMFFPPNVKSQKSTHTQRPVDRASIQILRTTATILDPSGGSSSRLTISELSINFQTKPSSLVQANLANSSSASQTSLRAKSSKILRNIILIVSLGEISLAVSPQLMHLAGNVLRINKQFRPETNDPAVQPNLPESLDKLTASKIYFLEIMVTVHHLRIQAAAENLILVIGINGAQATSTILVSGIHNTRSFQQSLTFEKLYLQARSPADPTKEIDSDILAALAFTGGRTSLILRIDSGVRRSLKLVLGLEGIRLHVPRSALRLYHFVGQWRADYLPGMEAALQNLVSEYNTGSIKPDPPMQPRQIPSIQIQIHGQVSHFEIALQVMHGTWLSWEVHKTVAYVQSSGSLMAGQMYAFGLQTASMVLKVSSATSLKEISTGSRINLMLPPLSLAGNSDGTTVHTLVLFDYIEVKVKPSHWDTLLAVQQKFGQDFNDLMTLAQQNRSNSTISSPKHSTRESHLHFEGHLKMHGFRIGLEGISSTVLLECQDINGEISNVNGWSWDLGLSDLALSLAPRISSRQKTAFNRNHKSAFVIIDFNFSGSAQDAISDKVLKLSITKIHAVMQPSSIGEFGDFIDNLQAELFERQEQRALELAAFKEKTARILRTFDASVGESQLEKSSWITDLIITVSVNNVGVAFPLTHSEELELSQSKDKELIDMRAFLFSIRSIKFETHRGETGQADMQHLSLQFISGFKQSSPEDFKAENHQTRNWLLYPEMKAQLRSSIVGASRKIWIKADVSGFILDIDSTISSYVFALIDVYRQGKERVERLSTNVPRTPMTAIPTMEIAKPVPEKRYIATPMPNIFSQLVFNSGKVRLYSKFASQLFKTNILASSNVLDIPDDQILALGAEVFNLPIVSVWGEYRAPSAPQKPFQDVECEPSVLMFNSTVFSSQNTLRPSLLPFLTELVNHIEVRMRKASPLVLKPPPLSSRPSTSSLPLKDDDTRVVSSMQISFSLRIDKSKLELTCQPDVNVVAGLHWESGGFVVNISPGAHKISFFGSVGGLTIGLKHGFLSDDCVRLDARNLTFSVAFAKMESEPGHTLNSISIVLDTEFLGAVRFSRLQDILCFKAVWLDRIPIFNNQSAVEPKTPVQAMANFPAEPSDVQRQNGFSTIALLRIRKIQLDVDLGQSITKIKLELHQSAFRTKLTDDIKEVLLHIGDVSVLAHGNMSGRASVSSCVFETIRRSEDTLRANQGRSNMLELRLTSGSLSVTLESDHQQLLLYRAKPLEVEILDDWTKISHFEDRSRPLELSFSIRCSEIITIVNVGTVPKLLSYANKFKANLDSQRQGAARESQTFRITRTPKPDNPLSAVAEAMLHSARTRFKEAESDLSYVIRQHMHLQLDVLRLIVFPRSMRDMEIAQFIGQDVRARLSGVVGADVPAANRDLHLSFSSMVISKYTQVAHAVPISLTLVDGQDGQDWLSTLFKDATEAIIVGLPSMKMHMISEELMEDAAKILVYDFYSEFVRREGMKAFEDIYITLNMSLYSWLTILRKNLTREMEQVRATEDWRTSIGAASNVMTGSQRKKKIPDPLLLTDTPRSATLPSGGASAFSPSSSRLGWVEHDKSPLSAREQTPLSPLGQAAPSPLQLPSSKEAIEPTSSQDLNKQASIIYRPRNRHIERLTMRQLGDATPDVMHPFFMKKAGFNLEDSLPQYVNEYAARPLVEILEVLLKVYSQQLLAGMKKSTDLDSL